MKGTHWTSETVCRKNAEGSTAIATALVSAIGHDNSVEIAKETLRRGCTVRQAALSIGLIGEEEFDRIVSPEAVMRLGHGPNMGES